MKIELERKADDNGCVNTPLELLEAQWQMHYFYIAAHAWPSFSDGGSPTYRASQALVLELISLAFPGYDAKRVYEMACECGEINAEGFRESLDYEMFQRKLEKLREEWYVRSGIEYALEHNPEIVKRMRDWLSDCEWRDVNGDDIAEMSAKTVIRAVDKHHEGGVPGFLEDERMLP